MNKKTYLSFFLLLFMGLGVLVAQTPKKQTIEIMTNSVCTMCTGEIEGAIKNHPGIIYSYHDSETKILTVKYKTKKTNADAIRKAVTMIGYDADDMKGDPEARMKLDACCRPPSEK